MTYGDFRCLENYDGGARLSSEQYTSIVLEPQPKRKMLPNQGESLAEIAKKLFPCAETTGNGSNSNNDVRRIRKTIRQTCAGCSVLSG